MMQVDDFLAILGSDFYAGVPDSQLRALCDTLLARYGAAGMHHQICANEGNATAAAAGYYLATGSVPVVYLQNSGIGNIVNPVASLLNRRVYGIPCIFLVGWRGEPGVKDEPQHDFQGEVSYSLLHDLGMRTYIFCRNTTSAELKAILQDAAGELAEGKQVAILIQKGALQSEKVSYHNNNTMRRETAIRILLQTAPAEDVFVATTGKASRELYEIREQMQQEHSHDFLLVGSMGHASSLAMEIARQRPERHIWCIDGDGATLMHMGAMAVLGTSGLGNITHVLINNGAHESVGGQPTVGYLIDFGQIAEGCGYRAVYTAATETDMASVAKEARSAAGPVFLETRCAIGSRPDLGRPEGSLIESRQAFMAMLQGR